MLADFRSVHPVATVHLQGLSSEGVEELVQEWPNAPADLVPQLCRLTDGNPLFLDEILRQLGYREAEQSEEGDAPVPPDLEPDRSDPGAGGAARVAAARGRDLPAAGGGGGRARVRSEHRGRGRRADPGSTARRIRPCRGVTPAAPGRCRPSATATPSPTAWCATPFTASSCAGAGSATTTRSPVATERAHAGELDDRTSTSWPTTSTWVPRWPEPTRPSTTARPRANGPAPAGVRGSGGPFRPQPGGGRAVRAADPRRAATH